MTRAAEIQTESPDLQALFDQDWTSGKYRRPKCSKADFYAGWLVAYERFRTVAPVEKIAIVETATPKVEPEHVTGWTPALSQKWLDGVRFSDPRTESSHRRIHASYHDNWLRLSEYNSGEWTIERKDPNAKHEYLEWDALRDYKPLPLRVARIVAARELKGAPMPEKTVRRYEGSEPLKREMPTWSGSLTGNESAQAIPDSLLRKLAIKAGRPKIAP